MLNLVSYPSIVLGDPFVHSQTEEGARPFPDNIHVPVPVWFQTLSRQIPSEGDDSNNTTPVDLIFYHSVKDFPVFLNSHLAPIDIFVHVSELFFEHFVEFVAEFAYMFRFVDQGTSFCSILLIQIVHVITFVAYSNEVDFQFRFAFSAMDLWPFGFR